MTVSRNNLTSMNYNEARNEYSKHRKNMVIAERDAIRGSIMQIIPIAPLKRNPTKITANKPQDIEMTPKREKIFFVRDYLEVCVKISAEGLARKYGNIYKNTRVKPDPQLVKDFAEILSDLVNLGKLRKTGSYRTKHRRNITYEKIINPDKIEELRKA